MLPLFAATEPAPLITDPTALSTGVWHNLIATTGGPEAKMNLYVDGVHVASQNSVPGCWANGNRWVIGVSGNGALSGKYAGVGIWNRVLAEHEIEALYLGIDAEEPVELGPAGLGAAIRLTSSSSIDVSNSIFWGNDGSAAKIAAKDSYVNVNHCDIEGSESAFYVESGGSLDYGVGNLAVEPGFVGDENYQLSSQAGVSPLYGIGFINEDSTSVCIDRANPSSRLKDEFSDLNNKRCNLGVYGGTSKASKSPAGFSMTCDINNDDIVDIQDFSILAADWLNSSVTVFSDFNRDDEVNVSDLDKFAAEWLSDLSF